MALLGVGALTLWIFGGRFIDPTMVALVIISVMLIGAHRRHGTRSSRTRPAWNVLAWFATLVVLADGLEQGGLRRLVREGGRCAPGRPRHQW